jgi:hypothetical protein
MRLEVIGRPLTYKWPGGKVHLQPGIPVDLPDARAKRLLDKASGKVRVVETSNRSNGDLTGHIVKWESRMFWAEMRATVLEDLGHSVRCFHPLTDVECVIPKAWLSGDEVCGPLCLI